MGSPGVYCICHLYCEDGDKPEDCSTVSAAYEGQLGWPVGAHTETESGGEDVLHRVRYCSTHNKYIYKTAVWVEPDWDSWWRSRAPKKLRISKGNY